METLRTLFDSAEKPLEDLSHSNKSTLLLQLLKLCIHAGDKILVFSQSIATLDFLEELLTNSRIKFFRLDGQTKMSERPNMIKEFNRNGSKYDVFLISTRAGGLGFNLPGANRVIIYDFSFNPTHEEQAIGRAYRLGQTKPVYVYRFISSGTFEENMHNNQVFKIQLAFRVVEKRNTKAQATRQNEWLRDPKKTKQDDLSEHFGKDKVLDNIVHKFEQGSSIIHGIKTTETLQEESDEMLQPEDEMLIARAVADHQRRLEDPEAYREDMQKREAIRHQLYERKLAATNAALAAQRWSAPMGPPTASAHVLAPSTYQAKPRQAFSVSNGLASINGLPSNPGPSTALTRDPAVDLSRRSSYATQPGTSVPVPINPPTKPPTPKTTPQPSPAARNELPATVKPTSAKESPLSGSPATNGSPGVVEKVSSSKARPGLTGTSSGTANGIGGKK